MTVTSLSNYFRRSSSFAAENPIVKSPKIELFQIRKIVSQAIEARFSVHPSGRVLLLPEGGAPWKEHLFTLEEEQGKAGFKSCCHIGRENDFCLWKNWFRIRKEFFFRGKSFPSKRNRFLLGRNWFRLHGYPVPPEPRKTSFFLYKMKDIFFFSQLYSGLIQRY